MVLDRKEVSARLIETKINGQVNTKNRLATNQ
jgi:hypothetical protein